MIIPNAYIVIAESNRQIPCQLSAKTVKRYGMENEEQYPTTARTALVEADQWQSPDFPYGHGRITLADRNGNAMGDYSIMQADTLEAVGQVKLELQSI